jgi:hypothetical protein
LVWRHVPGMETEQSASSAEGWARAHQMGAPRRTEQLEELTSTAPKRRVSSRRAPRLRVLLRSGVAASAVEDHAQYIVSQRLAGKSQTADVLDSAL